MANRDTIDRYLAAGRQDYENLRQESRRERPALYAKVAEARRAVKTSRE